MNRRKINPRYMFLKKRYKDYLILLSKKGQYRSFGDDKKILEYIKYIYQLEKKQKNKEISTFKKFLDSFNINYIILGIGNDLVIEEREDNKYNVIKYQAFTYRILEEIRYRLEK